LVANPSAASELVGLETLPGKESSRIEVLARGLSRAGFRVRSTKRSLALDAAPRAGEDDPIELDPEGDHRMAFAFALLGLCRAGVSVRDPECVAKSWPEFWRDLEALGAIEERDATR
jgi:3-phosphoshikimate 1-carboxyvinyltransferase